MWVFQNVDVGTVRLDAQDDVYICRVFRAQGDWTLTHTTHKDEEQSTIETSITLDDITLTDSLIR
jgi:hypothetical protein